MKELNSLRNRPAKTQTMAMHVPVLHVAANVHLKCNVHVAPRNVECPSNQLRVALCVSAQIGRSRSVLQKNATQNKRSLTRKIPRFIFLNVKAYGKSNLITYYARTDM